MASDPRKPFDSVDANVWEPATKPNSAFSPPAIALVAVIASAFLIVTYYRYFLKYCKRCFGRIRSEEVVVQDSDGLQLSTSQTFGLDEALMKKIPVFKYREGANLLIEGTECAVCLLEFEENETLRILPKCSHAFHINCIDMWLRSHANCPLCRSNVVENSDNSITIPPPPAPSPVLEQTSTVIIIHGQDIRHGHDSSVEGNRDAEINGVQEVKSSNMEKDTINEAEAIETNHATISNHVGGSEHECVQELEGSELVLGDEIFVTLPVEDHNGFSDQYLLVTSPSVLV